jgi:hypothetical protein
VLHGESPLFRRHLKLRAIAITRVSSCGRPSGASPREHLYEDRPPRKAVPGRLYRWLSRDGRALLNSHLGGDSCCCDTSAHLGFGRTTRTSGWVASSSSIA